MVWCRITPKPLFEPMLVYCSLDQRKNISVNYDQAERLSFKNVKLECRLQRGGDLSRL